MYLIQLNEKQKLECLKLKEYSEYLLSKNFPNIETRLHHIRKTINGLWKTIILLFVDVIILIINIKSIWI